MAFHLDSPSIQIRRNKNGVIRKIKHDQPYLPEYPGNSLKDSAIAYIHETATMLNINGQISKITETPKLELNNPTRELRFQAGYTTQSISFQVFAQCFFGIPILGVSRLSSFKQSYQKSVCAHIIYRRFYD